MARSTDHEARDQDVEWLARQLIKHGTREPAISESPRAWADSGSAASNPYSPGERRRGDRPVPVALDMPLRMAADGASRGQAGLYDAAVRQ
jgi:hypothetical protein